MSLIMIGLFLLCRITLLSGRMVALSLIGLLVFLLQVLGFLLTSLSIVGEVVGGVMLTVLVLILMWHLVGVSALFLGLFNLSRGLKRGESSWLCSPRVRFTLVLIILV